jgi:hypothetical protein
MALAASLMASLGLDRAPFNRDLNAAAQEADTFSNRFTGSNRRIQSSNEDLLMSSHRVSRQVYSFTQQLASGADASQLLATGLEGIGRSLKIGLGPLLGIGIGAALGSQFLKAYQEAEKLRNELSALIGEASSGASFKTFDQLAEQINKIHGKLGEVHKQQNSLMGAVVRFVTFEDPMGKGHAAEKQAEPAHRAIRRSMTQEAQARASENLQQEKKLRDIPESGLTPGAFSAERVEAAHKMMGGVHAAMQAKNMALVVEEFRKYKDEVTAINQKEEQQKEKYAEAVGAAKEKTLLQALEIKGETKLAEVVKEQLEFQRQINDEKRKGHPEIAAELEKQRKLKNKVPEAPSADRGSIAERWNPGLPGSIEARWGDTNGVKKADPSKDIAQGLAAALENSNNLIQTVNQLKEIAQALKN